MLSFEEINKRRIAAGLTRKAIYDRAKVDGETWRRLANGRTDPNTKTLKRLTAALEELVQEREQAHG